MAVPGRDPVGVDDDGPSGWTDETARRLLEATSRLVGEVQDLAEAVVRMHGGSAEVPELLRRRAAVLAAAVAWDERVAARTGYCVLPSERLDDDEPYGAVEELVDPDEPPRLPAAAEVSVVSRYDLAVVDVPALLAEARREWRSVRPEEDERDAAYVVDDVPTAVDVLLGRAPEPYERFHVLPGVEVRAGMQVLVDPEGSLLQPHDGHPVHDLEHPERAVALPGGRVLHPHGVGCG